MAIWRRLFQDHRHLLTGAAVLALAGFVAVQAGGQQLMLEGPGTTPNAKLAAERLGLDGLAAEDTPKVPLKEGIDRMVKWYLSEGKDREAVWHIPPAETVKG